MICPLVIDKALALTVSLADSVMVSNAGEAAVSGVSMVDLINVLMIEVFSALAVGGAVVVSQRIGAKCFADAKRAAEQLLLITLALSLGVSALLFCFRVPLLTLLFHRVEPDVMTNCRIYLAITCLSYPFLAVCNAAVAVFRAQGNTRTGMFVGILINLINVAGNAILVYGFRLGAVGVAIPTLVSRAVGGLTSIVLLFRWNGGSFSVGPVRNIRYCRKTAMQLLHVGAPNAMESAMFQLGKLLVIVFLSGYGTTQIAADTMANRLAYFSYLIGLSINLAIVPVTGQCVGAQEFAQARINTRKVLLWCYLANVFSCALVILGMGPVLRAYQASLVTSGYVRKLAHGGGSDHLAAQLYDTFRAARGRRCPVYLWCSGHVHVGVSCGRERASLSAFSLGRCWHLDSDVCRLAVSRHLLCTSIPHRNMVSYASLECLIGGI